MQDKKKLLFFVTEDWYFISHRLPLALAAQKAGFDISVVARVVDHGDEITNAGFKLLPLQLSRRSINPLTELKVIRQLTKIYRAEKPDIVHQIGIKPVTYGIIAAKLSKTKLMINALAGLGFLFTSQTLKAKISRPFVKLMFRLSLNRRNSAMILQNPDDLKTMLSVNIDEERLNLILGSGVDTDQYLATPEKPGKLVVVLAARMLWDKGVGEYVEAARILQARKVDVTLALVGEGDDQNPHSISNEQLQDWHNEGCVQWWGRRSDMHEVFADSHIFCLPSNYGEGVPKVLIEAAACGKAIVTTDTPGCREIVQDGVNGILVPICNATAVADALQKLVEDAQLRQQMGIQGRERVKQEFALEKVNAATLALYEKLQQQH